MWLTSRLWATGAAWGGDGRDGRSGQGLDRGLKGRGNQPEAERHTSGLSAKPVENLIEWGDLWCVRSSWSVLA